MRLLLSSHVLALCLAAFALGSNASALDYLYDARPPQLPFVSTIQSVISYVKPDYPLRPSTKMKTMRSRNIYHQGTHSYRGLSARYDYPSSDSSALAADKGSPLTMKTTRVKTWRPKDTSAFLHAHRQADYIGIKQTSQEMDWDEIEVDAPDVTDRETLLALGKMASKAYDAPKNSSDSDWMAGGGKWNLSESFGWVEDGIRGHIFATDDNATIVVALKGTSAALLDDGSTSKRDKENVSNFPTRRQFESN
jgi:lipase ATG15